MSSVRSNIDALVKALITAEHHRNAAPELRDWHQARVAALATALSYEKEAPAPHALIGVEGMLEQAIVTAAGYMAHPFSGYLECPQELYALVQPFTVRISELQDQLYREWFALARAALLRLQPHLAEATTTSEELMALGFDDSSEPNELDFF